MMWLKKIVIARYEAIPEIQRGYSNQMALYSLGLLRTSQ
jgi:hypothetical protein